ncbi:MAG TPA: hypothetical protein VFY00_06535 [Arenimonas sp.]|nr:hypothetical protein [Arenimonas sp.]
MRSCRHRPSPSRLLCIAMVAGMLAACDRAPGASEASTSLAIDGQDGDWITEAGTREAPADAQFHRHGVATGVQLRAHDGEKTIELFGSFLGEPADPVFIELQLAYEDGAGTRLERVAPINSDGGGVEGVQWQQLEIDTESGIGHATVKLDIPVCVDEYSGPLEYETRCHQVTGSIDTPLVHNPALRVVR